MTTSRRSLAGPIRVLMVLMACRLVQAYVLDGSKWLDGSITMQLQLGAAPGPLMDGFTSWNASAEDALTIWNPWLSAVQFKVVQNSGAPIGSGNGQNNVFWSSTIYGQPFGPGVLAYTESWVSLFGSTKTESDVIFNSNVSCWNSYRGSLKTCSSGGTLHDFHRVALHEFGHVLGLDHPDDYGQVVSAQMNARESNLDTLAADDIAGARALYGNPPPDTTPPAVTITTPTSAQTYTTTSTPLTIGGSAADNVGVTQVSWVNSRGGGGTASGTTAWSAGVGLQTGQNVITVTARDAAGNTALDTLTVTYQTGQTGMVAPFGQVDSPLQAASGVVGAIGVTGWALDNVGVSSVKIYRNCLPFDIPASCQMILGNNVVLTGDATFVAGVRPDVEAAFPSFPQANRAGWGFLLLTNMLPHVTNSLGYGGQGPLTLYVFATDGDGNVTLLGRSLTDHTPTAISMANDTITKPFGAIDTPAQGETVSGTLTNFGWVLTPDSNTAPDNADILMPLAGATMNVFVDGVPLGTVGYNNCRGTVGTPVPAAVFCNDDIASIFGNPTPRPTFTTRTANVTKYRNLDAGRGAIGVFGINTTLLANGLHSIAWGVTDSAGRVEGIGSRNFIVLNNGADAAQPTRGADQTAVRANEAGRDAASDTDQSSVRARYEQLVEAPASVRGSASSLTALAPATGTVWGRTGFDLATALAPIPSGADGARHIGIPELGRLEISLGASGAEGPGPSSPAWQTAGFLVADGTLRDLPPGSHLDPMTGVFTWAPGPGYFGVYRLTFVRGAEQIPVDVTIRPAGTVDPTQTEVRMFIDAPNANQLVTGPLTITGWALDPGAAIGSGIDAVHVWAIASGAGSTDPAQFLGAATLGGARPDLAAAFGAPFGGAGYSLTTSTLPPGEYDLIVYVWSHRTARWEDARTVRVKVR